MYISIYTLHFINVVHLPIPQELLPYCGGDPESYAGSSISIRLLMPFKSEGMGQTKCSPWTSMLGITHGAINPTSEKFTVIKPPEPMEEAKTHTGLQHK